ncbi:MAG TPA: DUF2939 domain-containing protein [Caulobacteraceae bacterium]|nr:DUF2939 domain-containing protein [Caulobacteraceae bacterium]
MKLPRQRWTSLLGVLAVLSASGCATAERVSAAGDVHALLVAIRDDDRAAFDAHVDRSALEQQLESRILERTQGPNQSETTRSVGAALAGPLARLAGEALLRPDVFRKVAEYYGYKPDTPIPGEFVIASALRPLGDGRVCAAKRHGGPCLITFADEQGVWRLVSFDGDVGLLRLR